LSFAEAVSWSGSFGSRFFTCDSFRLFNLRPNTALNVGRKPPLCNERRRYYAPDNRGYKDSVLCCGQ